MRLRAILSPLFGFMLVSLVVLVLAGCERRFTHARFEMIREGCDCQEDVRHILGKPKMASGDVWYYEDLKRHQHAQIFFTEDGRVLSKEWMSAKPGGEWEGHSPYADEPPPGEVRERHTRTKRSDPH
jgi:hypothetical protein